MKESQAKSKPETSKEQPSSSETTPAKKPEKSLHERLLEAGFKIGSRTGGDILPQRPPSPLRQNEIVQQIGEEFLSHRQETHGSPITPTKKPSKS